MPADLRDRAIASTLSVWRRIDPAWDLDSGGSAAHLRPTAGVCRFLRDATLDACDVKRGPVRQDSYAVFNVFASWDATDRVWLRLNADNLTDEKYITSLYNIGYYSAPQEYSIAVGYRF